MEKLTNFHNKSKLRPIFTSIQNKQRNNDNSSNNMSILEDT